MSRTPDQIGQVWDERYRANPEGFGTQPSEFLAEVVDRIPSGGHVYLPGDGYGRNGLWLAQQGYRVTLADLSAVGVEHARRIAAEQNLPLEAVRADVATFDPGPINGAVLVYIHLAPKPRRALHKLIQENLAPGAPVILEAFTPRQRSLGRTSGGPSDPAMLYTSEMLREDFPTLTIERLGELTFELKEGAYHTGIAEIVRMLAVKR